MKPISRDQAIPAGRACKTLQWKSKPTENKYKLSLLWSQVCKLFLSRLSVKYREPLMAWCFPSFDMILENKKPRCKKLEQAKGGKRPIGVCFPRCGGRGRVCNHHCHTTISMDSFCVCGLRQQGSH